MSDLERLVFEGRFNDDQIIKALRRIESKLDDVEDKGKRAFDGIGGESGNAAVKIGAIGGAVAAVTTKLLELGQAGIEVLKQFVQESIETARGFESIGASLTGIFGGSEELAADTFEFIRGESRRLGLDLSQLATTFLPKVGDLDQFTQIAEVAAGLAGRNAAEGAEGAQVALREALSGDFVSLAERFDIGKQDIANIKELQAELGNVEGLIAGLGGILTASGQNFEAFADTSQTALNRLGEFITDLQNAFAAPLVEGQGAALSNFLTVLEDNREEIELIAGAIGDVIGLALELASTRIFEGVEDFDASPITAFIGDITEFISTLGFFGAQLTELVGLFAPFTAGIEAARSVLEGLGFAVDESNQYFDESTTALDKLNLFFQDAARGAAFLKAAVLGAGGAIGAVAGNIGDLLSFDISFEEFAARVQEAGQTAFDGVIDEASQNINDIASIDERVDQGAEERRAAVGVDEAGINQVLSQNTAQQEESTAADEEATKAKEELAKAQEKVNDAQDKFATDKARKEIEEQIKLERQQIDLADELAKKREDAARKNAEKVADIFRKNADAIADASRDLARTQEDISKNGFRELEDAEKASAQKRVDIETQYRRELERIRDRFTTSARDAIRNNDAIALVQAQEQRDRELQEAERGRQEETQDASAEAERRRDEINVQLEREIQDAQVANQRKLQDLRASLQRDLQEQRIAFERETQQIALYEERKRQELQKAAERRRQDREREAQERLADLQKNLEKELALIEKANKKRAQLEKQKEKIRERNIESDETRSGTNVSEDEDETQTRGTAGVRAELRHSGGAVTAGRPYTVKPDEEVVTFPQSGQVIPINNLISGDTSGGGGSSLNQQNSFSFAPEFQQMFTPQQLAQLEQLFVMWTERIHNV